MPTILSARPLSQEIFAPYGEVIETSGRESILINAGTSQRFDDLARIDVAAAGGRPRMSIFRAQAAAPPYALWLMERHPLGSQAFVPLNGTRFVVVVAPAGAPPRADQLCAFLSDGRQGVNYARGVWHHPLLVLERAGEFVVVDRGGAEPNCDEEPLPQGAESLQLRIQ